MSETQTEIVTAAKAVLDAADNGQPLQDWPLDHLRAAVADVDSEEVICWRCGDEFPEDYAQKGRGVTAWKDGTRRWYCGLDCSTVDGARALDPRDGADQPPEGHKVHS